MNQSSSLCIPLISIAAPHHVSQPLRRRACRVGHYGIWGAGNGILPAMRHIAMAIPAGFTLPHLRHHVGDAPGFHEFGIELCMATDAILHDHRAARLMRLDHLGVGIGQEYGDVPTPVFGLEEPLTPETIVRHMAIIARGVSGMGAVHPGSVVGDHDVAIHAGARVIAQVGVRPEHVGKEHQQPCRYAAYRNGYHLHAVAGKPTMYKSPPTHFAQ